MPAIQRLLIVVCVCLWAAAPYRVARGQSPGGVSAGLTLWMRASQAAPATGGTLTAWPVAGGVTQTFTRSGTQTVLPSGVNFNPAVRFNGSGKLVGNTSIAMSEFAAVVAWNGAPNIGRGAVVSPTTNNSAGSSRYAFYSAANSGGTVFAGIFAFNVAFSYVSASPAPPSGEFHLWVASGTGNVLRRDGVTVGTGTYGSASMSGIPQLGSRSTNDGLLNGDLAEVIVYDASKAGVDRDSIESYLAIKYGITLGGSSGLATYVSSSGAVLWTGRPSYPHDVFGIGRDDGFALKQAQSNSANTGSGAGFGQSGKGNIVLSSPSSLGDQDFLMLGNDGADLSNVSSNVPASTATMRVHRQWKVQRTGDVGTVTLQFDTTGLPLAAECAARDCVMLVDADGDGDFQSGPVSALRAARPACGRLVFADVWLPEGAVVTFASERRREMY